jgi:hypothetical protein
LLYEKSSKNRNGLKTRQNSSAFFGIWRKFLNSTNTISSQPAKTQKDLPRFSTGCIVSLFSFFQVSDQINSRNTHKTSSSNRHVDDLHQTRLYESFNMILGNAILPYFSNMLLVTLHTYKQKSRQKRYLSPQQCVHEKTSRLGKTQLGLVGL